MTTTSRPWLQTFTYIHMCTYIYICATLSLSLALSLHIHICTCEAYWLRVSAVSRALRLTLARLLARFYLGRGGICPSRVDYFAFTVPLRVFGSRAPSTSWSSSDYLDLFLIYWLVLGSSQPSGIGTHSFVHGARKGEFASHYRPPRGFQRHFCATGLDCSQPRWFSRPGSRSLLGIAIAGDSGRKRGRFLSPSCGLESGIFRTWSRPRTCSSDTTRAPRLWHGWKITCGQVSATWRLCLFLRTAHGASNGARRAPSFAPCAAGRSTLSRSRSRATLQQRLNRPGRVHRAGTGRVPSPRQRNQSPRRTGKGRDKGKGKGKGKDSGKDGKLLNRAKAIRRSRLVLFHRCYLPCRRRPRSPPCPKPRLHRRLQTQQLRMRR